MTELAYWWNTQIEEHFELPVTTDTIAFAVILRNDLSSNAWRVRAAESGDFYIMCRNAMKDIKVSLHPTGKQQIAFTSESSLEMTEGRRFWNQWREPKHRSGSKLTPSFRLVFPSWGLNVTQAMRDSHKAWKTNQVFVEAAETPMATVVSFILTDSKVRIPFNKDGETRRLLLGVLPAGSGRRLWVVAHHAPEGRMREEAERVMSALHATESVKLNDFANGELLDMCASGWGSDEVAFLMPFQVPKQRNTADQTPNQTDPCVPKETDPVSLDCADGTHFT